MRCGRLHSVNWRLDFTYSPPSENEQLFGARRKIPEYRFIGEVVAFDKDTMTATIRNVK